MRKTPLIPLPGGTLLMGTPAVALDGLMRTYGIGHREILLPETPQHRVEIAPFSLQAYPVTNSQYATFVTANPTWAPGNIAPELHNGLYLVHWTDGVCPPQLADHPVTHVSWFAARAYAAWLGLRLPTEAEWEYAARTNRPQAEFPWGNEPPSKARANYANQVGGTTPIGSYPATPWGLYDLAGNVWEYCQDLWFEHHDRSNGASDLARRAIRGGSWQGQPVNLRLTYRDSHPALGASPVVGFRCAADL